MNLFKKPQASSGGRRWMQGTLIACSICLLSACSGSDNGTNDVVTDSSETSSSTTDDGADIGDDFVPVVDPNDVVPPPSEDTIAGTLLVRSDYSTLLMLIEEADLADALNGDNSGNGWTLFAFTDIAYANAGLLSLTDEQNDALVRGHLHPGRLPFSDIQPGVLTMTQGSVEVTQNADGTILIGGATVVARDRVFSNGIIHFVDSVLEIF